MRTALLTACLLLACSACQAPSPGEIPHPPVPELPPGVWRLRPEVVHRLPDLTSNLLNCKPVVLPPGTMVAVLSNASSPSSTGEDSLEIDLALLSPDPRADGGLTVVDQNGKSVSIPPNSGVWTVRIEYAKASSGWSVASADLYDPQDNPQGLSFESVQGNFQLPEWGFDEDDLNHQTWFFGYRHGWRTKGLIKGIQ